MLSFNTHGLAGLIMSWCLPLLKDMKNITSCLAAGDNLIQCLRIWKRWKNYSKECFCNDMGGIYERYQNDLRSTETNEVFLIYEDCFMKSWYTPTMLCKIIISIQLKIYYSTHSDRYCLVSRFQKYNAFRNEIILSQGCEIY